LSHAKLPRRAHLGLRLASAPDADAAGGGLAVHAVAEQSSAERAGVQTGDRLLAIGDVRVRDLETARRLLKALMPGDALDLVVRRGGEELVLRGVVAEFPLERHPGARVGLDEVSVGAHRLRATAVLPERPGPHPVVYFLPGAHWASEEYPLRPDHPVPALLGALARAGFASFRVERSGMGDSEGPPCTRVGFEAELAGYRAGLERLVSSSWVDPKRVFLLGHSIGAATAPLLAADAELTGVLVYAPSALRISRGLIGAAQRHAEREQAAGRPQPTPLGPLLELIRLVVAEGQTPAEVFRAHPELAHVAPDRFAKDEAYRRVASYYHELERRDLAAAWQRVRAPVLSLHGTRDWICTAEDARHVAELAPAGEYAELTGVDHQMSDAPEGEPLRLASTVTDAIVAWLSARD
jgi:pimeloyl-ACP methyl ester carboxylesterase